MKNGICPKCGSTDVRSGEFLAKKGRLDCGQSHPRNHQGSATIAAWLDNYVCARCGYVESYIADPKKLAEIAERWPAVPSATPDPSEACLAPAAQPADGLTRGLLFLRPVP